MNWKYNGTAWVEDGWNGSRYLDTANNVVGVNITSFSVFAPMGSSGNPPVVTLNRPENGSSTPNSWAILNATVTDADNDNMTVYFYANNNNNGLNASEGLVYIGENVANGTTLTYNLTALPIKPSEDNLSLLMHLDNRSEFGEHTQRNVANAVYDFSGNGNNGTLGNANAGTAPTWNVTGGRFAGAFEFDGINDYINVSDDPSLRITGPLTVEAWVNFNNLGVYGSYIGLVSKWDNYVDGFGYGIFKEIDSNRLSFHLSSTGSNNVWIESDNDPSVDTWYHVVGTFNGSDMLMYVNGVLQSNTNNEISSIVSNKNPVTIGSFEVNNHDFWFNGTIDEVAIYNRSLSADEILNHYRLGLGKYYWKVNASDGVLSNESDVWEFNVADQTAPSIQLNYPDDKANLSSSTVNFNWTATDNIDDVLLCNLTIDGVVNQSDIASTSGQPTNYSVSGISTGVHNWSVTCRDGVPNVNTSETRTFGVNNSAPNVTLNSPPNGSSIPNSWAILNATVTDADDDPMTVYFYANNNSNGLNASEGLVYVEENVAAGSTITYNLTALPIKPSEEGLLMLMHFDNRSEFGENSTHVYDFSGNAKNGTVEGKPDYNISGGKFAGAYAFDGTDDYVEAPAIPQISGSNSRTVEFRFKTTYNLGNQPIFDGGATGTNDTAFEFFTTAQDQTGGDPPRNTPGLYYAFWHNDVYLPDINYSDGNWHHVALTLYSNNTTELYYDGTKPQGHVWNGNTWSSLGSQPFSLSRNPNTPGDREFLIGKSRDNCWDHGNMHFNGTIDEVAIYNRSLSASEILDHYRLGEGKYYWKVNATDGVLSDESEIWEFTVVRPDLRIINVTFDHWDTTENRSSISETGTGYHVKENKNITINVTIANYANGNVTSNFNVSFFDSAGVYGNWSRCFWNSTYNVSTEGELGNVTTGYPHNTTYMTGYWNPSLVGTHNISVWANPANSASESAANTTNNNASAVIHVSAWQKYYGNVSGSIVLADSVASSLYNWTWSNETDAGYAYIVNDGVTVNWSALHALGCDSDNTLNASGHDFLDADTNLAMIVGSNNATGFADNNITELWSGGDPGNATNKTSFTVYGNLISNVSIVNSTDMTNHTSVGSANFVTGILWDATLDTNGYYDTADDETLVFVTGIRVAATGLGGDAHNYEFAAPCTLNPAVGGDLGIYMELK
jgi:hypothetical protein